MKTNRLFESININRLHIANRIVMPAIAHFYSQGYSFTDRCWHFYMERAKGGVGLMIIGPVAIDKAGGNPFMTGLFDDLNIPVLKRFITQAHAETDVKIGIQLMHMGGYTPSRLSGMTPIAPSAIRNNFTQETPSAMATEDIAKAIHAYAAAAERAKTSGADYVEILAGGGYLIGEFLSPLTNRREDEYGGSPDNRRRFGLEVIRVVRKSIGKDSALGIRISGSDFMDGGNTLVDSTQFCIESEKEGIDNISVTGGWHETKVPQLSGDVPAGTFTYLSLAVKEAVKVPVFASNRLGDPLQAGKVLEAGKADLVCWARPLLADPELPVKTKEGRFSEIVYCISCNYCVDQLFSNQPLRCSVNPRLGREETAIVREAKNKKKILVAGGGVAGMQFAIVAAQRGHKVTLYEKAKKPGGQLNLIAAVPGKSDYLRAVSSLYWRMKTANVEIRLGKILTANIIKRQRPDAVIMALGSLPLRPGITGINGQNVVDAWDVLSGEKGIGKQVVVIGGGGTGCDTAWYIANLATIGAEQFKFLAFHSAEELPSLQRLLYQSGRVITIVEMLERPLDNVGPSLRWSLLKDLKLMGVKLYTNTKVLRIDKDAVIVKGSAGTESIPADTVIFATGVKPVYPIVKAGDMKQIEFITIGDARKSGKIYDAINEAFETALNI